jgi:hypothetical protein
MAEKDKQRKYKDLTYGERKAMEKQFDKYAKESLEEAMKTLPDKQVKNRQLELKKAQQELLRKLGQGGSDFTKDEKIGGKTVFQVKGGEIPEKLEEMLSQDPETVAKLRGDLAKPGRPKATSLLDEFNADALKKAAKKAKKGLKALPLIGPLATGLSLMGAEDAAAAEEQITGIEGLSSPEEKAFEDEMLRRSKMNREARRRALQKLIK